MSDDLKPQDGEGTTGGGHEKNADVGGRVAALTEILDRKSEKLRQREAWIESLKTKYGVADEAGIEAALEQLVGTRSEAEQTAARLKAIEAENQTLRSAVQQSRLRKMLLDLGPVTDPGVAELILQRDVDFSADEPAIKDGGKVDDYAKKFRESHPYLFPTNAQPGVGANPGGTAPSLADLSPVEQLLAQSEALHRKK